MHVYARLREEARRFGAGLGAVCVALWWRADAEVGETRENARSFGPALGAVCGAVRFDGEQLRKWEDNAKKRVFYATGCTGKDT